MVVWSKRIYTIGDAHSVDKYLRRGLMNLQDIIYFNYLAESLSFTDTAAHFYVSQPSISMSLKRLETELETTLIDRKRFHKKMNLTASGEILNKHASIIIDSLSQIKDDIHDYKNQIVYFGFLPTIGGHFMSELLPRLGQFTSSVKFVEEESSDIMYEMVRSGEVPIAIIGSDLPHFNDDSLIQIPIATQKLSLWAAPDHPLTKRNQITANDLKDTVFISLEKGYTHERIFDRWTQSKFSEPPQTLYTKEIQTALSIASSTHMVAFMIDILVKESKDLVKIPISGLPEFYVSLILNKNSLGNELQREFNNIMIELAKDLSENE